MPSLIAHPPLRTAVTVVLLVCLLCATAGFASARSLFLSHHHSAVRRCNFSVRRYGAMGDGKTLDTDAIMRAVAAANAYPSRLCPTWRKTVLFDVPEQQQQQRANYLSAPLDLTGSVNLTVHLTVRVTLTFPSNRSLHPITFNRTHGGHRYAPLLQCGSCTNFTLSGDSALAGADKPTIDAKGPDGWYPVKPSGMEPSATPIPPYTVECWACENFEMHHLFVLDCPFTCIAATNGKFNNLHHLELLAPISAPNVAGVYLDGLEDSKLSQSKLSVSDDCVTIMAWTRPSKNVVVDACTMVGGQGLSFGSMIFHGITNASYTNIVMDGSTTGIRFKAQRMRGGKLANVKYENISLRSVGIMMTAELDFKHEGKVSPNPPVVNDVLIRNVTGWGDLASYLSCIPESPCIGWRLENVFSGNSSEVVLPYHCNQYFQNATLHNTPPSQALWPKICDGMKLI